VPGQNWNQLTSEALPDALALGVCIGHKPSGHLSAGRELSALLAEHYGHQQVAIIPILLPGANITTLSPAWDENACIDFRHDIGDEQATDKLITLLLEEQMQDWPTTRIKEGDSLLAQQLGYLERIKEVSVNLKALAFF
jgi:hypothetical protein